MYKAGDYIWLNKHIPFSWWVSGVADLVTSNHPNLCSFKHYTDVYSRNTLSLVKFTLTKGGLWQIQLCKPNTIVYLFHCRLASKKFDNYPLCFCA